MDISIIGAILLAHLVGDYLLQNDEMATKKTTSWAWALLHGAVYTLPFMLITLNPWALLIIGGTHAIIDRYRLAKHFIWAYNNFTTTKAFHYEWSEAKANGGYPASKPVWMSTWLMIVIDNSLHLLLNVAAIAIFA